MLGMSDLSEVLGTVGLTRVARVCGVAPSAVHKWKSRNQLPRTEWTGETCYAAKIAELHGGVTVEELLRRDS